MAYVEKDFPQPTLDIINSEINFVKSTKYQKLMERIKHNGVRVTLDIIYGQAAQVYLESRLEGVSNLVGFEAVDEQLFAKIDHYLKMDYEKCRQQKINKAFSDYFRQFLNAQIVSLEFNGIQFEQIND